MDQELRTRVFQRLNIYAIVATLGWPTAIAATAALPATFCASFLQESNQWYSKEDSSNNHSSNNHSSNVINSVADGEPTIARLLLQLRLHQLRLLLHQRLLAVVVTDAVDQVFQILTLT